MTWWSWIIFWVSFWAVAFAYLARRVWKVWPHARDFGRTVSDALDRTQTARDEADKARAAVVTRGSGELVVRSGADELAWDKPASHWRDQLRRARKRHKDERLDDHTQVWASWRRPLD